MRSFVKCAKRVKPKELQQFLMPWETLRPAPVDATQTIGRTTAICCGQLHLFHRSDDLRSLLCRRHGNADIQRRDQNSVIAVSSQLVSARLTESDAGGGPPLQRLSC
jgi:hypothetical protein